MGVNAIEPIQALESLRDSTFDALSAYSEVVDNSIQADANAIAIEMEVVDQNRKTLTDYQKIIKSRGSKIKTIAFIDDGHGMDSETLGRCLQLGFGTRLNDRKGIGRFGVGMTLGAIHECQLVEVFSKQSGASNWLYTKLDISQGDCTIPTPFASVPPNALLETWEEIKQQDSGTIVVWSLYDRQNQSSASLLEGIHDEFSRVYRKFLAGTDLSGVFEIKKPIAMFVNGKRLKVHDPLFVDVKNSAFPEDVPATEAKSIEFDWLVEEIDAGKLGLPKGTVGKVVIRMSLYPEFLRSKQGAGSSKESKDRRIGSLHQGFSICRAGKEVYFGAIPYWRGANKEIDRFWGCEINFLPLLDRSFKVRNIKVGAEPIGELKEIIYEKTYPTIKGYRQEIQKLWRNTKVKEDIASGKHHTKREEVLKVLSKVKQLPNPKWTDEVEETQTLERILETSKEVEPKLTLEELRNRLEEGDLHVEEGRLPSKTTLYQTDYLGKKLVVVYNLNHTFHNEVENLISDLEAEVGEDTPIRKFRIIVDALLICFEMAVREVDPERTSSFKNFCAELRNKWSFKLKQTFGVK